MESKENNYGRNHGCKGPNIDTRWTYHKGIIIITRSFHDKFHIGSMGMNTKVQGRLPLLQCITFHSLLIFEEIAGQKIYLAKYQKSKTRGNSRVHTDYGRHKFNPSGHFYESIQPSTKQKIRVRKQSIEVKADDTIYRRYYVSGKNSQDFGCEGHCRITTQQWI